MQNKKKVGAVPLKQLMRVKIHNLNNCLFVISGRLEMLLDNKRLSRKVREELVIINGQVERIKKLIEDTNQPVRQADKAHGGGTLR